MNDILAYTFTFYYFFYCYESQKLIFLKVEVHERQVMLQATKGDDLGGWVAIDDITVVENVDCIVFPGDDAVHN